MCGLECGSGYWTDEMARGKCDPEKGHAEYVESVPGPRGSANETEFDAGMFKYVSWGCQWHPLNKKSTKGGTGWP